MTDTSKKSYTALERELEACAAELEEERAYRTAINDVLRIIGESPSDLQPVFDVITERAMDLCDAGMGSMTRFDGEQIHMVAYHGVSPESEAAVRAVFPMLPGRGLLVTQAIEDRAPVQSADIVNDTDYAVKDAGLQSELRNVLAVPMLIGDTCIGSIGVGRAEPGLFSDNHIKLLQTFADQAVIAIENARLFNETQEALDRQSATAEILGIISRSPTDAQPVFDAIAERSVALFGAEWSLVTRYDGALVHLAAARVPQGVESVLQNMFPTVPHSGLISLRAILAGEPVQTHSLDAESGYDGEVKRAVQNMGLRSALAVPILQEGRVIGSITVARSLHSPFSDKQVNLLETFADQAVIAIENARLFNETEEALSRQTATAEILGVISSSPTDAQPVFDAIAERAGALSNSEMVLVTRYDGEIASLAASRVPQKLETAVQEIFPTPPHAGLISLRAILEGKSVQTLDIEANYDGAVKRAVQDTGMQSVLGVPILRHGRAIGSISVGRTLRAPYTERQISLLESFADQAVIAIENARLFNETQEALNRQTATAEILSVISSSPTDVEPVFDAITERAVTLCNAAFGFAVRFDGELMHIGSEVGLSRQTSDATRTIFPMKPAPSTISGRAVLERAPVQIPDVSKDTQYMRRQAASQSMLSVPLINEGQVLGAITVGRPQIGLFPDNLVNLLKTFAEQAVIAIENVRLFNETQEALEQQTASSEILHVISASPTDVQPVFDTITALSMKLCNAKMGAAMRFDGEWIHLTSVHGLPPEAIALAQTGFPVKPGRTSLSGRIVLEREPVQIVDLSADAEYNMAGAAQEVGSCFGVPLMREDQVVGTLVIAREEKGPFPEKQINLLKTFADQAVIAIENVRLFNETQEALEQQTAISEVLRVITESPSDVQPVLEALAERAADLCTAATASIYLTIGDKLHHVTSRGDRADDALEAEVIPIDRTSTSGRAVLDRKTIHVEDMQAEVDEYPRGYEIAHRLGHRTIVVAPLLREGQPFGTIVLRRMEVRPFNDRELALLRTFGDQAAIALENVRLFNETTEALEHQTAAAEVLRVISSSVSDTAPVFEKILDSCERLFECGEIVVTLTSDDGLLHLGSLRGALSEELRDVFPIPLEQSHTGVAIRERRIVHTPDVGDLGEMTPAYQWFFDKVGNFSNIVAPMLWEGRGIGSIVLTRHPPRAFTDKEIALLETFADQAVIAIQNARLFNETNEALEQQTATAEVLSVISSSVADTAPVFEKILDSCERLFASEELGIMLAGEDGLAHVGAFRGVELERLTNLFPLPLEQTALAPAIHQQGPVHFPNVGNLTEMPPSLRGLYERVGNFSIVIAPMLWEGRVVGSISVNRAPPKPFSDKEIALLVTFADQAVIAIENARLFHEIEDKSRQLEIADQHKSEFLANMSHELRTPLNAIIGFSEVLIERMFGELNEKQDDYLKDIYSSGKHLLALINDILDLSKIEAGRMDLELESFDVEAALANTLTLIRERAQQHGIALALDTGTGLGELYADQRKLKQIMLNLLSNAVKFTPDGGSIDVRASQVDGTLEVAVTDTGIGIAETDQDTIFQEFRQVGGDYTNKQEGTGLGLALTKRFVELHGGTLSLTSEPGTGSTFTFTLPDQS